MSDDRRSLRDWLFGWLYEWHVRHCRDCYWDKTPGAEGYEHCRVGDFLWKKVLGYAG